VNDTAVHTFYSGRTTNWFALWLTTAMAVPLLALGVANGSWTGLGVISAAIIVVAVLANLLTANSVRSIAGPNGVTVHFGVFGWPRFRYPLDRIRDAEAVEISVSPWGGAGGSAGRPVRGCG
jgi:hypothetical protein